MNPTVPPTTTVPSGSPTFTAYLMSSGSPDQDVTSTATLPLSTSAPTHVGMPANYDTDRDDLPGLLIERDYDGLGATDSTDFQEWVLPIGSATTISGPITLTMYLADEDFSAGKILGLTAGLYVCGSSCSEIAQGTWSDAGLAYQFRPAQIDLGTIDRVLTAGDHLVLRVASPKGIADEDVLLAYATTFFPSRLEIG